VRFSIPSEALDLDECLFSGQVFRWARTGEASYLGVDGDHWYEIERRGEDILVDTNASQAGFASLFRLETDVAEIRARIAAAAPQMESCLDSLAGLRMMRPSDPSEVFYSFLCTANNNLKRIMPMVAKLAAYGEPLGRDGPTRFPASKVIAAIPETELRAKGFGYRGATIPFAAREVMKQGGDEWIASLKRAGYETAHNELIAIKGIGHKLADCICLYGLHYDEAVPIDTHLWQAACQVFVPQHAGKALTELRYRQVGDFFRDRFGSLAGWAHLYLYYGNMTRSPVATATANDAGQALPLQ